MPIRSIGFLRLLIRAFIFTYFLTPVFAQAQTNETYSQDEILEKQSVFLVVPRRELQKVLKKYSQTSAALTVSLRVRNLAEHFSLGFDMVRAYSKRKVPAVTLYTGKDHR